MFDSIKRYYRAKFKNSSCNRCNHAKRCTYKLCPVNYGSCEYLSICTGIEYGRCFDCKDNENITLDENRNFRLRGV